MVHLIIGGYATAPPAATPDALTKYLADLLSVPAPGGVGLELPVTSAGLLAGSVDEEAGVIAALRRFPGRWHVLTLVPGTMARLGVSPSFGLASDDAVGRAAAVEFARLACAAVARVVAAGGIVVAVEVQSAPRAAPGVASSAASLQASLVELAAMDWHGAEVVVEHCDDARGPAPVKGFLPLADELAAVAGALAAPRATPVGVSVNWARSVLEAHDAGRPLAHIAAAGRALRGLVFSGCTGATTAYGPPWQDAHCPWSAHEATSELSAPRLVAAVAAAAAAGAPLLFAGVKIALQPPAAFDAAARVAVNAAMLAEVASALAAEGLA